MNEPLQLAEALLDRSDTVTEGLWPRAAAILGRQALEDELRRLLGDDIARCSTRAQLLVLREVAGSERAGQLDFAYQALSNACHYHPYELPPTRGELRSWLALIRGDPAE